MFIKHTIWKYEVITVWLFTWLWFKMTFYWTTVERAINASSVFTYIILDYGRSKVNNNCIHCLLLHTLWQSVVFHEIKQLKIKPPMNFPRSKRIVYSDTAWGRLALSSHARHARHDIFFSLRFYFCLSRFVFFIFIYIYTLLIDDGSGTLKTHSRDE